VPRRLVDGADMFFGNQVKKRPNRNDFSRSAFYAACQNQRNDMRSIATGLRSMSRAPHRRVKPWRCSGSGAA